MPQKKIDGQSFGYKHLQKSGWSEGEGLGRENTGDADPIKVNLKHDKSGLGHHISKDFTNQWWDHVFNKAAAKVSVGCEDGEVKVTSQSELSDKQKNKLKRKVLYGNFIKGSTLTQGQETHEAIEGETSTTDDSKDVKAAISILTDDQLLAACGGRTAHKGARHGFKMNGKLARVEQQEEQQQEEHNSLVNSEDDSSEERDNSQRRKKRKSKKKSRDATRDDTEEDTLDPIRTKSKKDKRKDTDIQEDTTPCHVTKKSKKKYKRENSDIEESEKAFKKKKRKKERD